MSKRTYGKTKLFTALLVASALLWLPAASLGQVNTSLLEGTVTDPSGAVVAGAQVVLVEVRTQTKRQTITGSSGVYNFVALPIGNYTITITHSSFRTFVQSGITILSGGVSKRLDVRLGLGQVSQTVEVKGAATLLDTLNTSYSDSESTKTLIELPLEITGLKRDPMQFLTALPGYQASAGFSNNINGSIGTYSEATVDGVNNEFNRGGPGMMFYDMSSEAISEYKVVDDPTADMGLSGGVIISTVSKSGTNQFHGAAYEYLRNDAFDAKCYFCTSVPFNRQNEYGFTVGGPLIIPHIYNGKDKTFFFLNLGWSIWHNSSSAGIYSMPTAAMKNGDFSAFLGPQIGTDPLGRPVSQGEIYNPSTTRTLPNGAVVRDPFPGNIIPSSLFSPVSEKFQSFYPGVNAPGLVNNYLAQGGIGATNERYLSLKIDHYHGDKDHFSGFYWNDNQPVINPFPLPAFFAIRTQATQGGHMARLDWTRTISPEVVNEATVGIDRNAQDWTGSPASANGAALIGQPNALGPCTPTVNISGYFASTQGEISCDLIEGNTNWSFVDNLSYAKGKHLLKFGGDFYKWDFNFPLIDNASFGFVPGQTGLPTVPATGLGYASFLLGAANNGSASAGSYTSPRDIEYGFYFQDEWRVTNKLTLNLGLRYDIQPFPVFHNNDLSQFDPNLANPGAGGRLGALTFAGFGPGRLGSRQVASTSYLGLGPRVGFAYEVLPNTVLRGSWGMMYGPVGNQQAGMAHALSQGFSPLFSSASLNGFTPAFNWTNGFPLPSNIAPQLTPTAANGNATGGFGPDAGFPPRIEEVHFGIQRQLAGNVLLEASYIGTFSHGISSCCAQPLNQLNFQQYGGLGNLLFADINSPAARAAGIPIPYAGFQGPVSQALVPYPQYLDVENEGSVIGVSTYNALQVKAQKEFSNGLSFLVGYTFSKEMSDNSNNTPGFFANAPQDAYNHRAEMALSSVDMPQSLIFNYTYDLPVGPGKRFLNSNNVLTKYVLGGWSIAGIQTYQSGTPIGISTNASLPSLTTGLRPDRVNGVPIRNSGVGCGSYTPGQAYLNVAAFKDPAPFSFGNVSPLLGDVRTCAFMNENISIFKTVPLFREKASAQVGAQFFNIFNRHPWGGPNNNIDVPQSYGTITGTGPPRSIQLYVRFTF